MDVTRVLYVVHVSEEVGTDGSCVLDIRKSYATFSNFLYST